MARLRPPSPRQALLYLGCAALLLIADPWRPTFIAGCVFVGLAILLRIWSFGHLDKNEKVVTTGPYAHTRNPAYLGSLLALVGIGLSVGSPHSPRGLVAWGLAVVMIVLFFTRYLPRKYAQEYGRLSKHFGEDFERHAANVPDFWPRLRPWRSGDDRTFSWQRVIKNREWSWPIVLAGGLVAVWSVQHWSPLVGLFDG